MTQRGPERPQPDLIQELALSLEVAATLNRLGQHWGVDSPFQCKIDDLLGRAGREPKGDAQGSGQAGGVSEARAR